MLDTADLKVEIVRPRGQREGGQHVGTASGVRVTHLPSGIEAYVEIGRSQMINREIAINMIEAAITHPRYQ